MAEGGMNQLFGSILPKGGGVMDLIFIIVICLAALFVIGGILWFFWSRKKWNLTVEFKLPRSIKYLNENEKIDVSNIQGSIESEIGKGCYDYKKGVVWLKRKGKKKIKMKPFRVTKYLQNNTSGKQILTVVQIGAAEFIPVMPESYMIMQDDETGEQVTVLDIKTDASESKAWSSQFEREAKSTYSIQGALASLLQHPAFLVGLVIFLWGLQFLLLYNRMKGR